MTKLTKKFVADKLMNDLKRQIFCGQLKPGSLVLSAKELSEKYHLSPLTVHRALVKLEEEGCLCRIQGKGTFVAPKKNEVNYIGLLIPNITNPEFLEFSQELINQAEEKGYRIIIGEGGSNLNRELRFYEELSSKNVKGILRFPNIIAEEDKIRKELNLLRIRTVIVNDFWFNGGDYSSIRVDEASGVKQIMDHLGSLGHSEIAYFDYAKEIRKDYMNAYSSIQNERNLKEHCIFYGSGEKELDNAIGMIFDSGVTAVFTPYDIIAIKILGEARRRGISVPGGLSIIGFGDIAFASFKEVSLTTLSFPKKALVEESLRLLLNDSDSVQKTGLSPKLVIRDSTGPINKTV